MKIDPFEAAQKKKERDRLRYEKIKDDIKAKNKEKYSLNKEAIKEKSKVRYLNNRDKILEKYHQNKEVIKEKRKDNLDKRCFQDYEKAIRTAPDQVCSSCHNLFFPKSVKTITIGKLPERLSADVVQHEFQACRSCSVYILQGRIPPMFHGNGLDLCVIPDEIRNLNSIEERMVSPLIPFMTITGGLLLDDGKSKGQKKLKGNVITVPTPIDTTLTLLPRLPKDCHCINIHLKRRIKNEHSYIAQQVNPNLVNRALLKLIDTPLYRDMDITKDPKWVDFIKDISKEQSLEDHESCLHESDDMLPSTADTIVVHDSQFLGYAPGEGQNPVNLLMFPNAEELSFPTLFNGHQMCHKSFDYEHHGVKRHTPAAIIKHQLRNKDRRFSMNTQNLFFKFYKLLLTRVYSAEQIQLRKAHQFNFSAQQFRDEGFVKTLCHSDAAYKFIKTIPSSPAFWENTKKEVLAMIRQLGIPTLFVTVSPSEHKWPELLVLLSKSVDGTVIEENEATELSYLEKDRLLRSDPVLVTRYNDERFRSLFKTWHSGAGPFRSYPIINYFYRVEFQAR